MKNLKPIEYGGQKVLLSRQVAEVFGITHTKVKKTFQSHRAKFVAGEHFYLLEGQELEEFRATHLQEFKRMRMAQIIYLWTAAGVKLLSERFVDGKKIYAELAREYFNAPEVETDAALVPVTFANQRVLLTVQIAEKYECAERNIGDNFNRVKEQFVEGVHYFKLTGEALRQFKRQSEKNGVPVNKLASCLYLWTEQGAILHCKMINTNKAWKVMRYLVEFYFVHNVESETDIVGVPAQSVEVKKAKPRSKTACVYAALMDDNTVKFGYAGNMPDRVRRFKREFGKSAVKYFNSPQVNRKLAQEYETRLKNHFAPFNVGSEFFNIEFEVAVEAIKNLFPTQQLSSEIKNLPVEIDLFEEKPTAPVDLERAKLLVEMTLGLPDSPFREQLAKETANLLFGEKIF